MNLVKLFGHGARGGVDAPGRGVDSLNAPAHLAALLLAVGELHDGGVHRHVQSLDGTRAFLLRRDLALRGLDTLALAVIEGGVRLLLNLDAVALYLQLLLLDAGAMRDVPLDDDEEDGHDREGEERGYRLRHSGGLEPAGERFAAQASSVMSFQMFSPTPTIPGSQTLAPSKVDSQRRPLCQTLSPFL